MRLADLVSRMSAARLEGDGQIEVAGVRHDSRHVAPGDLFACIVGDRADGHLHAPEATRRGAVALLASEERATSVRGLAPLIIVKDTRTALAEAAGLVYGDPSAHLTLIGVTGTNGKTTTTLLTGSILRAAGVATGTLGTLGAEFSGQEIPCSHTTPEADELQRALAQMRGLGARAAVMEVSSHAIAQNRVAGCRFDAGVFTNLSQDHLDYHGTMEAYFATKLRLFVDLAERSGKPFVAAVNLDDARGDVVRRSTRGRCLTYAVNSTEADVRAVQVRTAADRVCFRAITPAGEAAVTLPLGGAFQVHNALAAATAAMGVGVGLPSIVEGLGTARPVPGRFEPVPCDRGFSVIVDYAHTPDGLSNLLASARQLDPRRVLLVFGCGGDRDPTKRPEMGRIASEHADFAVLTSDNPRTEDPQSIIRGVLAGVGAGDGRVAVEPDRAAAIETAIRSAAPGDVVLIAGKGHETVQIVGSDRLPFDDRAVARAVLERI
ncbi:MAG TPA: UDP-N-acetylmuramoyl-L-alanyl-D-glutamate--2,6-diaminopimelate ligase [Chthonomonadales bacterium]|nr:UDP-N-acetylmuramoyl-L-alanyl-D-glutamate--2,6-diaminopimelate ligase [Chthonomonadales bacterium]